jgi:ligand-binding sensor domain-containing protein
MCADKSNNLWCAGVNGLIKYDGNQFTLLTNTNSGLLTNSFTAIACDKNNNVWCTDRGKYIYKIKDATVEVFDVTQIKIPFPHIQGSWIQEDPLGNIWYSSGKLLTHYDGEKWIVSDTNFVPLNQTNSLVIADFYITKNNDYVIATDKQAILLYRNGSWYQYTHENIAALPEYEPGIGSIYTIAEDKDGNILIGIAWWKPDNNPKILVLDKNIETNSQWSTIDLPAIGTSSENPYSYGPKAIVIDDDNKLWVGTNLEGVLVYNHYPPSTAVENKIENTLSILPNPANDYITIALKPSEGIKPSDGSAIYIYNTLSEKIMSVGTYRDLSVRINITDFPKGMYFVKAGGEIVKFVKM